MAFFHLQYSTFPPSALCPVAGSFRYQSPHALARALLQIAQKIAFNPSSALTLYPDSWWMCTSRLSLIPLTELYLPQKPVGDDRMGYLSSHITALPFIIDGSSSLVPHLKINGDQRRFCTNS